MLTGMAKKSLALSDDDFLALCREEQAQAVGMENDDELAANREKALAYMKGEMDIPSLPNRSTAVDTSLAEAHDTVMPDLMEIFTGGDDVATFRPQGEEDEAQAAQETAYVNHVLFNENDGWRVLYAHISDALLMKIGVTKVWGEEDEEVCEEQFEGQSAMAMELAAQNGEIVDQIAGEPDPLTGEALFDFTLRTVKPAGRCRVMEVPPEDFAFARDTVRIGEATYCAMRSRPRAQDLIADGYDRDKVAELSPYGSNEDDALQLARDQGGEHTDGHHLSPSEFNLHQVEIVEHYLRVDADDDGQPELYRIVTDASATILLDLEEVNRVPFAVSTPFLVAHRLIGMSLYDKLREVQRIKTVAMRAWLDSLNFALNQRFEVSENDASPNTLADLLNNIPGAPVRSKTGQAIRALSNTGLSFDVTAALEYMSTLTEQRTGIVRNAQGLNPDTLHDTAKGAMVLLGAAQKRVRMIARVFAETGLRDLYLLIHDVCRTTVTGAQKRRLLGDWQEVDPSQWAARNDMTIEVGVGSGGKEQEIAALQMVGESQMELRAVNPGMVTDANLYNTAKRLVEKAGLKGVELFFTDPAKAGPQPPPPPDPKVVEAQEKAKLDKYKIDEEMKLKREQMAGEFELERERMRMKARVDMITGAATTIGQRVELGGDPG